MPAKVFPCPIIGSSSLSSPSSDQELSLDSKRTLYSRARRHVPKSQTATPQEFVLRILPSHCDLKAASDSHPVTLILAEDLKVGGLVVARAGAKATGEVTNAKKSGMMGKAGELNLRLNYLKVGDNKIHLRGTKGKEGESGTTGAVVLTVLFGPIGLIKHGKNVEIKQGSSLKALVSDDISLPPAPPAGS